MSIFNPNINKKKRKIKLGKLTESGYEYSTKVDFKRDFSSQISDFIKERRAYDALDLEIKRLKEVVEKLSSLKKEKNIQYYYEIGKNLLFLDKGLFKKIAPTSVLRRIFEELPDILPSIKNVDMATRHLYFMYWIGHIKKNDLSKAAWEQWFEITKFKNIYKEPNLLKKILKECKSGVTGHATLNRIIKELIKNYGNKIN